MTRFRRAAFLFRRDLRLHDNTGLLEALEASGEVLPCFVFDPRQLDPRGPWFARNALLVHLEALDDLDRQLRPLGARLLRCVGPPEEVAERLVREAGVEAVFANADHTPFAMRRDALIERRCEEVGAPLLVHADALLHAPGTILTGGRPYRVFTPYHRAASQRPVPAPRGLPPEGRLVAPPLPFEAPPGFAAARLPERPLAVRGGRTEALRAIASLPDHAGYAADRDLPAVDSTRLSAHLKTGAISAREAWHAVAKALGADHPLLRQLHWRDFFTQLAFSHPRVFEGAWRRELDAVAWDEAPDLLEAWAAGRTGFPIVDAGMRELAATGFMHNRARMITASFLVKDLHLHWRHGEQHFARHLVDYDPCVNNGNWQWVASTGADAQPFFRVFNPWTQGTRFDPDCAYIKRWVPELAALTSEEIHGLERKRPPGLRYPQPLVDHRTEAREAEARFRALESPTRERPPVEPRRP